MRRTAMADVPERIRYILKDYVLEGDPQGIKTLGRDVHLPSLAWFPEEFERLLRAGGPSPQWWGKKLYYDEWTDDQINRLDRDLRLIWTAVVPDRPYPLDAASS
jgi:hypothetical protein